MGCTPSKNAEPVVILDKNTNKNGQVNRNHLTIIDIDENFANESFKVNLEKLNENVSLAKNNKENTVKQEKRPVEIGYEQQAIQKDIVNDANGRHEDEIKHSSTTEDSKLVCDSQKNCYDTKLTAESDCKQNTTIKPECSNTEQTTTSGKDHDISHKHLTDSSEQLKDNKMEIAVENKMENVVDNKMETAVDSDGSEEEEKSMDDEPTEGTKVKKAKKLTPEEIQELKQNTLTSTRERLIELGNWKEELSEDGTLNFKVRSKTIYKVFIAHFALKKAKREERDSFKRELGNIFAETDAVKPLCDIIVYCGKRDYTAPDGKLIKGIWNPLVNCSGTLLNFSDANPELTYLIVEHPEFLTCCCDYLLKNTSIFLDGTITAKAKKIVGMYLSIIHNIAQAEDHTAVLRSLGLVDLMMPYLSNKSDKFMLTALAILADIVDDSEAKFLETDDSFFKFLLKNLQSAMKTSVRRSLGWSASELARTVRRIARNDVNKKSLVQQGVLPLLVKLAAAENVNEHREAVCSLWTLSFDKDNQEVMCNDDDVMETFIRLRASTDTKTKKACIGALWNLREKLVSSEKYKEIGQELSRNEKDLPTTKKGHVMFSYQWANQKLIMRIRDCLKENGIKCWMDVDDLQGSTISAMARAVEGASVVLVCYSQKYFDSSNCRAEAEYAFQLKKPIIPLKMERNYQAREWLGIILGAKLFFEFSEKYTFESRMEGLLREIQSRLNEKITETPIIPKTSLSVTAPSQNSSSSSSRNIHTGIIKASDGVKKWSKSDVMKWIDKHQLSSSQFQNITGMEIAFLQVLRQESPDNFYKILNDMLKIKDLLTMAKFTFALEDTDI